MKKCAIPDCANEGDIDVTVKITPTAGPDRGKPTQKTLTLCDDCSLELMKTILGDET